MIISRGGSYLFRILLLLFCLVGLESKAYAEGESRIIREESGGLEQLTAIRVEDETIEAWKRAENIQDIEQPIGQEAQLFLEYGSDYGYQDMQKRSNTAGRQYAYQQLKDLCRKFTINEQTAGQRVLSGNIYYEAGLLDLSGYDLTEDEMVEVYFTFRHDNPQFFWLSNSVLYGKNSLIALTYDEYMDGTARKNTLEEISETAETVYKTKLLSKSDDYQKVLTIHDTLINEIEYTKDTSTPIAHSIAGAMTSERSAVCEGYAKVMQVMMNCYGILNIYITGNAGGGGHAWNMVRMNDGKYYWLDATWDDQSYEEYRHNYFLVGNINFTDHSADSASGSGEHFLYDLPLVSDDDYVYQSAGEELKKGDVNGDGDVTSRDALLTLKHCTQTKVFTSIDAELASDVNSDGRVTSRDALLILKYATTSIVEWPKE